MKDEQIINIFFIYKDNKYILRRNFEKLFNNLELKIQTYILNKFDEKSRSIKESLLRLLYNIENIPKCPICGNLRYFNGGNIKETIYLTTCNNSYCYGKLKSQRRKETFIKKYGVDHIAKLKSFNNVFRYNNPQKNEKTREKTKQTLLNKYGVEHALQSKNCLEKRKRTCLQKFGKENNSQTLEWKNKVIETCVNKYGVEHVLQNKEIKKKQEQTCIKRFGTNNIFSSKIGKQKIKQTLLNKYNVDSFSKTNEFKYYMSELMSSKEMQEKIYNTQKKNNSFNKSKSEDLAFELLKKKYPDVIHHYKDFKKYPFICDFYIPSLDLFIECQFGMYHNKRPFIGNKLDKDEVIKLQEKSFKRKQITGKNKSRYDAVIYTWTILDPKKRNIAKLNNLNFIEFWNLNELKKWINEMNKNNYDNELNNYLD